MSIDASLQASLASYGTVLNQAAKAHAWPHAFGREKELNLLLNRLKQPKTRSFVLVGHSGTGKSAILEELVQRVDATLDEPWIVLQTSASMLLAGTRYLGEMETRVKGLIDLAERPNQVLLYFTDIFSLVDAGRTTHSDISIGGFLMPYIDKGTLTLAGECTPEQFRMGFEKNPTFKKLFDVVRVEEPPPDEARQILGQVAHQAVEILSDQHDVQLQVPEPVLDRIFELSDSFFSGQCHPGKSIRLLEQVVSLESTDADGEAKTGQPIKLTGDSVIRALHRFTGIPSLLLDDAQPLDLEDVQKFFDERVLGQPEAIGAMVDLITFIKAGVTDPGKPMGVFFFVGPTGVGKTELAKALAEFIFGGPERMLRFDMSEFKDYNSFEKLIGNPQAKDGSPMQAGNLVARVRQEPFAVILLDEIEKAHPNIFDIFLQVFDDGRLTDPNGVTTSFTQTIIIMTSNVGSDLGREGFGFKADRQGTSNEDVELAMQRSFRPEFLNRIDRVVHFEPLGREHMRTIAERELGQVLRRSGIQRRNLRIDVDPAVIDVLLKQGFSRDYGARPLKRAVERLALQPVARQLVKLRRSGEESLLRLLAVGDRIKVTVVQAEQPPQPQPAKAVVINDPIKRRRVRVTAERLGQQIANLLKQVENQEAAIARDGLRERKGELIEQSSQSGFWDDPTDARDVLGEIHRIERVVDAVERVRRRSEDLAARLEQARSDRKPQALAEVAERLHEVLRHVDLVSYSVECRGPLDRCDAFVALSLIDTDATGHDLAGMLGDMYTNWARGKGFKVTVVHEEILVPGVTQNLTLLVEGISVYGILRGEEGIHELIYGKTSKADKQSKYVKVRVLPLVEDEQPGPPPAELLVKRNSAKGEGLRVKRFRSAVGITHPINHLQVQIRNGLNMAEAVDIARDLLRAEACRRTDKSASAHWENGSASELEEVIRRYTLRPTQSVKDQRTGLTMSGLGDLWNGALDTFLHAQIAARRQLPADGARVESSAAG
ncbi:MAG: AAA family ATPase [Pirellulales bacterium]